MDRPNSGSPVVDMTDVNERTRCGYSMAIVWAIIPPIEAPTTWARSMPNTSSSSTASFAMSLNVYRTSDRVVAMSPDAMAPNEIFTGESLTCPTE